MFLKQKLAAWFVFVLFFFPPQYLRSYLHLKAVDSRLSKIRNVKVRQSGAQMCVCGLWAQKISLCTFRSASELNDPLQNVPCG